MANSASLAVQYCTQMVVGGQTWVTPPFVTSCCLAFLDYLCSVHAISDHLKWLLERERPLFAPVTFLRRCETINPRYWTCLWPQARNGRSASAPGARPWRMAYGYRARVHIKVTPTSTKLPCNIKRSSFWNINSSVTSPAGLHKASTHLLWPEERTISARSFTRIYSTSYLYLEISWTLIEAAT